MEIEVHLVQHSVLQSSYYNNYNLFDIMYQGCWNKPHSVRTSRDTTVLHKYENGTTDVRELPHYVIIFIYHISTSKTTTMQVTKYNYGSRVPMH